MRRLFFLLLTLLAMSPKLCAQEIEAAAATSVEATQVSTETPQEAPAETTNQASHQETGSAAASSAEVTQKSNWQNWVFAGSALVTVTVGVVIISLNSGTTSH